MAGGQAGSIMLALMDGGHNGARTCRRRSDILNIYVGKEIYVDTGRFRWGLGFCVS